MAILAHRNLLSTIQITTTKRKLAWAQSIKAVFIRKMDFLLWADVLTALGWIAGIALGLIALSELLGKETVRRKFLAEAGEE
jgi:hypothetical protein